MRKTALAMLLFGIMAPAIASAQIDGGVDGMYRAPKAAANPVDQGMPAGHTGYSSDPNGNMGDTGRTGKPVQAPPPDAGAPDASSGGQAPQNSRTPSSY